MHVLPNELISCERAIIEKKLSIMNPIMDSLKAPLVYTLGICIAIEKI